MSSSHDRSINIKVTISNSQPQLLEGLDVWLRLGLISEAQVSDLSQKYLVCALPPAAVTPKPTPEVTPQITISSDSQLLPAAAGRNASRQHPKAIPGVWQSLMAELSVRWLLFLGVFMVVVSSGVLAATQWERFPAAGQYGVLLAYTLIFWRVSAWANRQPSLQLTAQTLQIVTLLLMPVNFWAMDSFGLWQNPVNLIVVAIASVVLTGITFQLLKNWRLAASGRLKLLEALPALNLLGLSYLHWGWNLSGFPVIAIYLAMVGTSLLAFYQVRHRQAAGTIEKKGIGIELPAGVVIYALVVLLVRAIFIVQVPVTQLGLALGICGWLVAWLSQQQPETSTESLPLPWEKVGGSLLCLGWLVSVGTTVPWQATAVSGLGLWFFFSRLQRFWLEIDLAAFLGIGLQTIWLVWRLVPGSVQEWAIATGTQLTGSETVPWALLSLVLFPYVVFIVGVSDWLHRASKTDLATFGEQLALTCGTVLSLISLLNPTLRSLNLLFSTVTLAVVTQRRLPTRVSLVYFTHLVGLLTLFSTIDRFFPNLHPEVWASILLAVMVAEWTLHVLLPSSVLLWKQSAWHIGLGLAGLSYQLLLANVSLFGDSDAFSRQQWAIFWLITPLALTGVASQTAGKQRTLASWLSVASLGMAQILTFVLPGGRFISLGMATGLMLVNTRYLRHLAAAVITVGFSLSFLGVLLGDGVPGVPPLSVPGWFLAGAIAVVGLWLARTWLMRGHGTLAALYAQAVEGWAIALCSFELLMLTLHSLFVYQGVASPDGEYLLAVTLIIGAIAYRSWQQPNHWAFYGLGWGLELLTAETLGFFEYSVMNLAIANIVLGLSTQLLGEAWRRRSQIESVPNRWHILPLLYGVLGALLRRDTFTSWTGLCTLAIAFIAIGVGRRRQELKPILYLGLLGVSISAYELLFYQLLQASGGALGDGFIVMSALGTSIMYAYRLLFPWLLNYLHLTAEELKVIAHLHWAWSSCLLIAAIGNPIAASRILGLGTGLFLIRYAIFQGRRFALSSLPKNRESSQVPLKTEENSAPSLFSESWRITIAEVWVYLGLLEVGVIRIFWLYTAIGQFWAGPLVPWKAPISCVWAYFLYILPWEKWRWPKRPWQHAAYILPLVMIWETRVEIHPISLLITAAFYIFIAKLSNQIRFTYISLALINWALFRWFLELQFFDYLWYVMPIGLSWLYIAQVDSGLTLPNRKQTRHLFRCVGAGVICGAAFLLHQETGLIPGILSILFIFAGLAFRVRAFLYVGTATFLLTAFYQLVIFVFRYSFFKWVIGLIVGISFISIAANFETRRDRFIALVRHWLSELEQWQ
ncbi:DUF2157 domain-containing protein [Coleofasciculus sp. FACHB-SPT36]|uniref:DUF2157 domain-containing protein n=1 Tax=Cyanophyceae TaxID=3028117 RepID=UPI00168A4637|nr:DUF2157 domain-containing protein [Coleofasciculus sp. FACHB-SPT36]MBD2537486.1 DUF2157 domain-containing protein [Coleofasciculus sp. FACHB-SPT36]